VIKNFIFHLNFPQELICWEHGEPNMLKLYSLLKMLSR
jgi:hypothetical protein